MKAYHFCTQISPISINEKFFGKTINTIFNYALSLFVCQKCKKNPYSGSRVMTKYHFWAQNGPFALRKIFLGKNH